MEAHPPSRGDRDGGRCVMREQFLHGVRPGLHRGTVRQGGDLKGGTPTVTCPDAWVVTAASATKAAPSTNFLCRFNALRCPIPDVDERPVLAAARSISFAAERANSGKAATHGGHPAVAVRGRRSPSNDLVRTIARATPAHGQPLDPGCDRLANSPRTAPDPPNRDKSPNSANRSRCFGRARGNRPGSIADYLTATGRTEDTRFLRPGP